MKLDLQLVENILGKGESFLSQGRSKSGSLDKRFKKFKIDTAQRQALTTLRKRSFGKQREKKKGESTGETSILSVSHNVFCHFIESP